MHIFERIKETLIFENNSLVSPKICIRITDSTIIDYKFTNVRQINQSIYSLHLTQTFQHRTIIAFDELATIISRYSAG